LHQFYMSLIIVAQKSCQELFMIFAQKFYNFCTVDMLDTSTLNLQTTVVSKQHDDILGYK
jgi:hypothetical protein